MFIATQRKRQKTKPHFLKFPESCAFFLPRFYLSKKTEECILDVDMIFKIAVTPASKFYRSDVLKDIRFPMGLIFEDNAFFIESFLKCERVYFHDEYLSNKRVRKGSITHTPNESFMDFIDISEILIDITKKLNLYPELKEGLFYKIIPNLYLRFTQVPQDIKPEFFNKIKDYFTSKKEEYDSDEVFQMCDDRVKEIFYSGIESENPREYELSIKCLDLTNLLEKTELKLNENIEIKDISEFDDDNPAVEELRTQGISEDHLILTTNKLIKDNEPVTPYTLDEVANIITKQALKLLA